jgi:transposase
VVEAKDTEIAALRAALEAGQARQAEVIRRLGLRVAELGRRLGMDSSNSSCPPSKEPLAAKRRPGGQPGHQGAGLEPARDPDRAEKADPPAECRSCGAGLAGAEPAGRGWGQVWDIPPVRLEKVHWLLPKLRCGACGTVTTADPPGGRAGTVVYGPNVNAAAILLDNEGNVPAELDGDADGGAARRAGLGGVRRPRA